jgi:hypothetical protein
VDCDALAAQIIAIMDGLQVQWVLNPDQVVMPSVFADYIAGVRPGGARRADRRRDFRRVWRSHR